MTTYRVPAISSAPAANDAVEWNGSIWVPRSFTERAAKALTTKGDLLYANATGTTTRLPIGSSGQVLNVSSGAPAWAAAASGRESYAEVNPAGWLNTTIGGTWTLTDFKSSSDFSGWSTFNTPAFSIQTQGSGHAWKRWSPVWGDYLMGYYKYLPYKSMAACVSLSKGDWNGGGSTCVGLCCARTNSPMQNITTVEVAATSAGNNLARQVIAANWNSTTSWSSTHYTASGNGTHKVYLCLLVTDYRTRKYYFSVDGVHWARIPNTVHGSSTWWYQHYMGFFINRHSGGSTDEVEASIDWVAYA